jgi:hypothetical protein
MEKSRHEARSGQDLRGIVNIPDWFFCGGKDAGRHAITEDGNF